MAERSAGSGDKKARLAAALRENLKRRKAEKRDAGAPDPPAGDGEAGLDAPDPDAEDLNDTPPSPKER